MTKQLSEVELSQISSIAYLDVVGNSRSPKVLEKYLEKGWGYDAKRNGL